MKLRIAMLVLSFCFMSNVHASGLPLRDSDSKSDDEKFEVATAGVKEKACALAIAGSKWVGKNPGVAAVICLTVAGATEWFAEWYYRDSKEQLKKKMARADGKQRGFLGKNWDGFCGLNKVSQAALGIAAGFAGRAAWVAANTAFSAAASRIPRPGDC